jgi:hypothetical protein
MEVFGTKAAAAGIHVVLKMRQAVPLCLRPNCCITATAARARRRRLGIAPQSVSGPSGQCGKHLESSALANAHTLVFFPQSAAASRNMRAAARRRVKLGAHDSRWPSPWVRPGATLCREQQWTAHDQTNDQSQSRRSPRTRPERRFRQYYRAQVVERKGSQRQTRWYRALKR